MLYTPYARTAYSAVVQAGRQVRHFTVVLVRARPESEGVQYTSILCSIHTNCGTVYCQYTAAVYSILSAVYSILPAVYGLLPAVYCLQYTLNIRWDQVELGWTMWDQVEPGGNQVETRWKPSIASLSQGATSCKQELVATSYYL